MGPSLVRILTPTANPQHGHWKACKAPNCCAPKEPPAKQGWQGCQQLPSTLQRLTSSGWKCERSSASIRHQKGGSQGCLAVWNLILFDPRWFRFLSNLTNYPTTQDLFCIRIRTTTSCLFAANGLRVALTAPPATLKWCEQHRGAACFTGNISAKKHRDNSSGWFVMTCHDHMIWHDDLLAKKRQLWQRWSFATELNHTKSQQLAVQPEHEPSHQLHMWRFNSSRIKASSPQAPARFTKPTGLKHWLSMSRRRHSTLSTWSSHVMMQSSIASVASIASMFTSSCGASSNICSATSSFRDASTSSWRCLQKLSTEPKSFQKRSLDVKRWMRCGFSRVCRCNCWRTCDSVSARPHPLSSTPASTARSTLLRTTKHRMPA